MNELSLVTAFFFFFVLRLHPQHMEIPRLGVESELQLLVYTKAIARSELRLQPTPQLMATLDPQPTERGWGSNPQPHGS